MTFPRRTFRRMSSAALVVLAATATAAGQLVRPAMVDVEALGNPADTNGLGAVAEPYRIGLFEVTNTEYVVFLNAVAADDPNGLFDLEIHTDSDRGGILRGGAPGSFVYSVKPDFDDKPAVGIDWFDAARFCNWLHNGTPTGAQDSATTEKGVYDLSLAPDAIERGPGALWFIPSHDEWYKAAYHDPLDPGADAGGTPDYWLYPTRSDTVPALAAADAAGDVTNPGPDVANSDQGADWNGENGNVTTVGACQAPSPVGAFDMGGNAYEWTDQVGNPIPGPPPLPTRTGRGGDFANTSLLLGSPGFLAVDLNMAAEAANLGLRVASLAAWQDLGGGTPGAHGTPALEALGSLLPSTPLALSLQHAPPGALVLLWVSTASTPVAVFGGTLHAFPFSDQVLAGADGTGAVSGQTLVPPLLPGTDVFFQFLVADPSVVFGITLSNGVTATSP